MISRRWIYFFSLSALLSFALLVGWAAMRQGWFSPTVVFWVEFENGEGLFAGTPVSVSGLKAGSVQGVELEGDHRVRAQIKIQKKFAAHLREDSRVVLARPFIVGDKVISIQPGSNQSPVLKAGSVIQGEQAFEITDLLRGENFSAYMKTASTLLEQLRLVVEGEKSGKTLALIDLYRQAAKSLQSVDELSHELKIIRTEFATSTDTKRLIKQLAQSTENLQGVLSQTQSTLPAVTQLSKDVAQMMPQLGKTLSETTFTLQALQRSFILSGGVERLKKDQKKLESEDAAQRTPASSP